MNVVRYITPLREGGSLPAIVEGDDGFLYVLKFRGAGQGVKALIAELIGGTLARLLNLHIPEIVFAHLDEAFGRTEPDEEIQDLLKASVGLNLGLHYLSGSVTFDPIVTKVNSAEASKIVWLDSLLNNVDRTSKNTNLLWWHKELWLIDHGAGLYFHHAWHNWEAQATRHFTHIKDHVLLAQASDMGRVDEEIHALLSEEMIRFVVALIPDEWLLIDAPFESIQSHQQAYENFLIMRFRHSSIFVKEAQDARERFI